MSGISQLPPQTVSRLSSAQSLTGPCSLIKELVENAVDAKATALFVELTPNALDRIRVRDNGHGINAADRKMLCKRHCTSKIQSMRDLDGLGGQSFGFRGEALASAAELSSYLSIRTRTSDDECAIEMRFDPRGCLLSEKPVPSPIGTTVEAGDFLQIYPVRRQVIEKSPKKSLQEVKKLLQTCALAKPSIKLSLKVLKASSSEYDWTFNPLSSTNDAKLQEKTLRNAVVQIFGKPTADQCLWLDTDDVRPDSASRTPDESGAHSVTPSEHRLRGFVTSPDCTDVSVIGNLGHYVSVDARPMSCRDGTLRDLTKMYRDTLRSALTVCNVKRIVNPFIVLQIDCPRGSYDVNVEPSKDDVLFHDAERVKKVMQCSLEVFYSGSSEGQYPDLVFCGNGKDLDHSVSPPEKSVVSHSSSDLPSQDIVTISPSNLIEDTSKPVSQSSARRMLPINNRGALSVAGNDFSTRSISCQKSSAATSARSDETAPLHHRAILGNKRKVPSAGSSASDLQDEDEDVSDDSMAMHSAHLSNPWVLAKLHSSDRSIFRTAAKARGSAAQELLTPAKQRGDVVNGSLYSPGDQSLEQLPNEQPFPYPLRTWGGQELEAPQDPTPASISSRTSFQSSTMHPDLAETLDYEARKQKATDDYRARIRKEKALEAKQKRQFEKSAKQHTLDAMLVPSNGSAASRNSPHKNRYNKAIASLQTLEPSSSADNETTARPGKHRSLRSTLPTDTASEPLDYVDEEEWTSHLILPLSQSIEELSSLFTNAAQIDDYINQGRIIDAFDTFDGEQELETLTEDVRKLLRERFRRQGGGVAEGVDVRIVLPVVQVEGEE